MSRTKGRLCAFHLLYQEMISLYFQEHPEVSEQERAFAEKRFRGTLAHLPQIDERLSGCAKGWSINRMNRVDLAILRLAVYELCYETQDVPAGVAINEAVELAKRFSSDKAPSFINGVLGAMVRQ